MSFRNPSQFNLNQMNSNQSNFNQSYLPIQNVIPQRDIKNHNNVFHNNINDPIVSEIITEWSKENSIDMVIGKMEVVYCNDECDVTDEIVEILRTKGLYQEENKEEYQQ